MTGLEGESTGGAGRGGSSNKDVYCLISRGGHQTKDKRGHKSLPFLVDLSASHRFVKIGVFRHLRCEESSVSMAPIVRAPSDDSRQHFDICA